MRSILHDAPVVNSAIPSTRSEPKPQQESTPTANGGQLPVIMLPVIILITGFSLVKLGVPFLVAIGIVAVATTIGLIRRANTAS
jgi:hypothetical protein